MAVQATEPTDRGLLEDLMSVPAGFKGLRFPCECVSSKPGGYSDPWAEITKNKLLPNGTKEEILNVLAQGPKQLLKSQRPSASPHQAFTLTLATCCAANSYAKPLNGKKRTPQSAIMSRTSLYSRLTNARSFIALCEEMSKDLMKLFERKRQKIERAFRKTSLSEQGWELSDITQCLFANMYRGARSSLEQRGLLSPRAKHANGTKWIFWAEQPEPNGRKKS
jgi:hypothetical protein